MNIHPDDFLFFQDVLKAMRTVARRYELPLKTVTGYPMPTKGMAACMGDCARSGGIRIVFRCTVDGAWCDEPMSPAEVWETAAHELAHLKHANHGVEFQELRLELAQALKNTQEDHRDRVLNKLVKMQAVREGEAALGNEAAAEAFAEAINRMLIEHELKPSDLDYARSQDHDPVIEVPVNLGHYKIKSTGHRTAWQEALARIVARAHLCTFLVRNGSNQITFVGTRSHAMVAEYAYGCLVPAADTMSFHAAHAYRTGLREVAVLMPGKSIDFDWCAGHPVVASRVRLSQGNVSLVIDINPTIYLSAGVTARLTMGRA